MCLREDEKNGWGKQKHMAFTYIFVQYSKSSDQSVILSETCGLHVTEGDGPRACHRRR